MAAKVSLWSRIARLVNPLHHDEGTPALALSNPGLLDPTAEEETGRAEAGNATRLLPWRRRDKVLEQMQHGHDRVLGMVELIQEHLALQNKRSIQVTELLTELTRGAEEAPKATREQAEGLRLLAGQMEVANRNNQAIVGALADLPRAAAAQKQAMDTIAVQVRASSVTTERLSDRLESVGQVVSRLGESLKEQILTLRTIQQTAHQQEATLVAVLDRQTQRFTVLTIAVIALATISVAALTIRLFA